MYSLILKKKLEGNSPLTVMNWVESTKFSLLIVVEDENLKETIIHPNVDLGMLFQFANFTYWSDES